MTSGPTKDSGGDMQSWFRARNFALFLAFLIFSSFPKVLLGRETFFYRDFILFCYPWAAYGRDSILQGTIPLWNPYNDCGLPFLAQWNTMVLYPLSLFYLIFPTSWAVGVLNLVHLFLAGMGMYTLAHRWTRNQAASCVAGLSYVSNGVMLHSVMWTNYIAGLAWLPWVIFFTQKAWQEGGARNILLAAVVGATEVLSGAPEPVMLTWGLLGVLWLADLFRGESGRRKQFWRFSAILCLVGGLAAVQMLPFLDLLQHSQRSESDFGEARWAMPSWGVANFVLPLFRCSPSILGVFSQEQQQFFSSYYLGIGTLALALFALWRGRQEKVYLLALVALAGVVLAMGENTPIYVWLRKILPLIKLIRYPIKFVVLTTFALPLLAAFGLDTFLKATSTEQRSLLRSIFMVGAGLLLVLAGILVYAAFVPTPGSSWGVALESGVSRAVVLVLVLGSFALLSRTARARATRLGLVVMMLLVAVDGLTHTANQNPTVTRACYGSLGIEKEVTARLGHARAMVHPRLEAILSQAATADHVRYCSGIRHALYMDCNLLDRIPMVTGFYSISPRDYSKVDSLVNDPRKEPPQPLVDFLGVSQMSAPDTSFTWNDRTNYMALATAGQRPVFATPDSMLAALAAPDFDPRSVVFLPIEARNVITVSNRSQAHVTGSSFSPQKVELSVRAEEPAMVVVAQTFFHNWHASVDGLPVKLWEANYAFQAVEVPAGEHQVRLVYEDIMFRAGTTISLSTLAICLVIWLLRNRQPLARPA